MSVGLDSTWRRPTGASATPQGATTRVHGYRAPRRRGFLASRPCSVRHSVQRGLGGPRNLGGTNVLRCLVQPGADLGKDRLVSRQGGPALREPPSRAATSPPRVAPRSPGESRPARRRRRPFRAAPRTRAAPAGARAARHPARRARCRSRCPARSRHAPGSRRGRRAPAGRRERGAGAAPPASDR